MERDESRSAFLTTGQPEKTRRHTEFRGESWRQLLAATVVRLLAVVGFFLARSLRLTVSFDIGNNVSGSDTGQAKRKVSSDDGSDFTR